MIFRARDHSFEFPRRPVLMGIVNITPDSFSDGGAFLDPQRAVEHGLELAEQGAEIIDIGGESTRPRADAVPAAEELRRVLPVIEKLAGSTRFLISIDTQKPLVAREALAAGAHIVNDIASNREDSEMWEVTAAAGAGYILMHMQGTPQTMQANPRYTNVVAEVSSFFADRLNRCAQAGLSRDQIVLDVGIGFGKRLEHNLELLASLDRFNIYQRPMLIGVSRKSFMGKLLGAELLERMPASIACALWGQSRGAGFIRTHDVAETLQALRMWQAIQEAGMH